MTLCVPRVLTRGVALSPLCVGASRTERKVEKSFVALAGRAFLRAVLWLGAFTSVIVAGHSTSDGLGCEWRLSS